VFDSKLDGGKVYDAAECKLWGDALAGNTTITKIRYTKDRYAEVMLLLMERLMYQHCSRMRR
jgi:hypothetical protein